MVKRPTGSGGEPSSPNCVASAGVKARHLIQKILHRITKLSQSRNMPHLAAQCAECLAKLGFYTAQPCVFLMGCFDPRRR